MSLSGLNGITEPPTLSMTFPWSEGPRCHPRVYSKCMEDLVNDTWWYIHIECFFLSFWTMVTTPKGALRPSLITLLVWRMRSTHYKGESFHALLLVFIPSTFYVPLNTRRCCPSWRGVIYRQGISDTAISLSDYRYCARLWYPCVLTSDRIGFFSDFLPVCTLDKEVCYQISALWF